ncbi:MAG: cytochrome c [candidate division NC10 bacterium]|nr:cytochrome c [candidate division NC10 bacterium]
MNRRIRGYAIGLAVSGLVLVVVGVASWAQQSPDHGGHGTPRDWKFSWPAGDAAAGREVFIKLECSTCHEVRGEQFPKPQPGLDPGKVGPELSGMAPLHPAEYFAEAIISPNAVVEEGKGYRAADGKSKMPSYNDLVNVQEVIDLVTYLKSLKGDGAAPGQGGPAAPSDGHGGAEGQPEGLQPQMNADEHR